MSRRIIDCCKPDCSERTIGCHATCPRYAAQKAKIEQEREMLIKAKEVEYDYVRYRIKHREIAEY